jgi:hypothetical protein
MQLPYLKATLAASWVLAMGTAAILANLTSMTSWTMSGWAIIAGLTFLPPLVMMRMWHHPRQTLSQSIQKEIR